MVKFLFDVDGTLTPSRGRIQEDFRLWLCDFTDRHECYLVTGSDQAKTLEQIGDYCYNKFVMQFQCSGNQIFVGSDKKLYESEWTISEDAEMWLLRALYNSEFQTRTGQHFEVRPGMINFSVLGRGATKGERASYVLYDQQTKERENIARRFNTIYRSRGIEASIGGETGLDIMPVNSNKAKAIDYIKEYANNPSDVVNFFGDACQPGGNDFHLAQRIIENDLGFVYNVKDYKETWNILKEIDDAISSIR